MEIYFPFHNRLLCSRGFGFQLNHQLTLELDDAQQSSSEDVEPQVPETTEDQE